MANTNPSRVTLQDLIALLLAADENRPDGEWVGNIRGAVLDEAITARLVESGGPNREYYSPTARGDELLAYVVAARRNGGAS
jgi:hypothetical protein